MNKKRVIALLFCLVWTAVPYAGRTAAQNTFENVEILVVDDFSNSNIRAIVLSAYDPDAIAAVFAEAGFPEGKIESVEDAKIVVDYLGGLINEGTVEPFVNGDVFNENCVVNLEEQGPARAGMIGGGGAANHGELVTALLEELKSTYTIDIHLEPVLTQGLTTDVVAEQIAIAVANSAYEYHVINMSFVIVPCVLVDDFARYQLLLEWADNTGEVATFQAALAALTQFAAAASVIAGDPLDAKLAEYGANVIPVASAGNFGLGFPYYPGAWDSVISVSGSGDAVDFISRPGLYADKYGSSNWGEVKMPAVWDVGIVPPPAGTSFAAPRLSFIMAVYLSQASGDVCRGGKAHPTFADLGSPAIGWPDQDMADLLNTVNTTGCVDVTDIARSAGLPIP